MYKEGVIHNECSVSGCVCVCVQIHWQEHSGALCRWIDVWVVPCHPHIVMCTLVLRMNREEHGIKGGVQVHTPGLFCVSYSFKVYYTRLLEGTAISLRR